MPNWTVMSMPQYKSVALANDGPNAAPNPSADSEHSHFCEAKGAKRTSLKTQLKTVQVKR